MVPGCSTYVKKRWWEDHKVPLGGLARLQDLEIVESIRKISV